MGDIIGHKGGDSQHVHYEAPDSLHSTSYARVLDLVSEGEILGLAHGLESVLLNGTPLQNADGTFNFTGATVDFRTGTQTQDYIPGFPDVESEVGVNVELTSATPWVHAITNKALSAIRITLGVPALSQTDTTNGDVKGYKVDYQIELSKDGGAYAIVLSSSFNGKTTTQFQRTARIDLPPATTGWSVRVTRLTANANTGAIADTTTVVSYTEVIDAKLRYPMSAIVGVQVDAKQFQNIPTRSYDLFGRIIQIPSNYDAKTRAYTGTWDGTFKPSWTDNPAWVFRDLALNDRYGLGHRITAAQLDKWALYAIARYCDGLVPDGKGGTEPRFTCNLYIQTQKQAYAVLQDIASIFRGISYWGAGSIMASADMPMDPVYVYTAANVVGGKFSRVGSSKKTRSTVAMVSWNDPADSYKAKVEYVEDAEGIVRYGIQQISLTAFGCTSQGQAQRVGRWALATARLETEMITFDVGMDGAIALPGQVIRVADPSRMGRRAGGRINTASGRVVVLDKAPIIAAGDKLTIILPTGVSETRTVSSIAGDAVTVDSDWTALPVAQSVWSVDSNALMAPTYKVRSVTEKDATTFTITATQHEPGKYDLVENGVAIVPRAQTSLNAAIQQPPAAVAVNAFTVSLQDVQKLAFSASCAAVAGAVAYEGAFQVDNGNWFTLPRQPGPVFDVLDVLAGYYTVKLAAVNAIGITSIETVSTATLVSKSANPKNAGIILTPSSPGFNVAADGTTTPASITVHADLLDLTGTVSFSAVGATISSSGQNATIQASNMPGVAATITASITALGQTFTKSIDIVKNADGAAGAASYTWIKYGTSAAGAGLTDSPTGMSYIGIAVNKSTATESTNAADYTWSLIKGSNGSDGASTYTGVVYLQQATQPSAPTGGTFNFTSNTLTAPTGWSTTRPASSTTPTWAVQFTFVAATIGATVTAGTWSTPVNAGQNGAAGAPGADGAAGAAGQQSMTVFLYQWNSTAPAAPNGTSTLNWITGANGSYTGTDSWATAAAANPGTPGVRLYVAAKPVTAAGGTTSTANISYSGAAISAWAQNGANGNNGANGANGAQAAFATVYQWALTIPAGPTGTATFTWSTGAFGAVPTGWSLAPGTPTAGYTLWAAKVQLMDTATATTTSFNWTSAAISPQGYAGGNGTNGTNGANGSNGAAGAEGLSTVTAYVATTVGTASTAPAATTGRTSMPAASSSGLGGTPSAAVPTLTAGQYLMQFDGSYNPATNQVTWGIPYQSSLKVGSLSAITTNTGDLTVSGTIASANGKFTVGANGDMVAQSAMLKGPDGTVLFSTAAGLTTAGAAPGTKNNEVDISWWQRGASIPWTQNLETNNIVSSTDFGIVGPRGTSEDLWTAVENGNDGGQGGGWDAVAITLDPTKTYRFVVPIRKHAGTGAAHWGTSNVANLNQSVTASNPYFATTPTMTADSTWYLFIGYIFPANSTGHDHSGAGILNCSTGQFIATGTNYNFLPGQGTITHRAYQYYSSNGARQFFGRPMINLVDGTEPSLREYLANGVVLNTAITLNSNGSLSGAGGGQVTLPGMGQNSYRVVSAGGNATSVPASLGLYKNGSLVFGVDRGYMLVAINRATGNITYSNTFDVYGAGAVTGGRDAAALASVLNSIGSDSIVVIYTSDEPSVNRMNGGLPAALYRHGASRAVFGSPYFQYRSAYVLIGIGGCGEGNGAEGYQGAVSNDTNAWVDESFSLLNGSLVGVSASFTPKSLQDYGYAGDLDATRGATFGTNVYGQINPANITTYIAGATIGLAQINTASIGYLSAISAELGSATISSAGFLRCGQTTFNSGTGWYLGMVGGVPKFSMGTSGGAGLRWDGTDLIIDNPKIGANMTATCSPDQYVLQRNSNQQFTDVFAGTFSVSTGNASSNLGYDWSVSSSTSQITINKYGQTSNQCSASVTGKGYSGQEFDLFINCTVTDLNNGVSRTCGAYIIVQIP